MKRKYGGGQSKESAKISWARHVLQGRTAMVVVEGPDGAPAETTHPDGCERAPLVETTPNPALQPLWRGHGKVRHPSRLWRRWARANLRGRGQSLSPTASEATSDMLSSASSSSLPPNETRSLTLAEGRWSGWIKRTGEISLCGENEARGIWAGVSSLSARRWKPLPRCFFLTGPWEEENGRARGAGSLSEKKAMRVRREARLMLSQWEQSDPASAASAWAFPRQETHSLWPSSACRSPLHEPQ